MGGLDFELIAGALGARPGAHGREPVRHRAAVAILLRDAPSGIESLLIRRAEDPRDPWSGQMAFPGGRAEPGDADLRATAARETREEIGIDVSRHGVLLGALDEMRAMSRMRPMDLTITPFVFRLTAAVEPVLSPEVTSVHWLPLEELLSARHRASFDYEHQGARLQFPCLRYDGLVIWGLTYRMLETFEERVAAFGLGAALR